MRAVIQRVSEAAVRVGGEVVGEIGGGLLVLVGVTHTDTSEDARVAAAKIANLRVMPDAAGVMNRSVLESGDAALVVSQFTLYGDIRRGRRPSWTAAAGGETAEPLVGAVASELERLGVPVATGAFGEMMEVSLTNDGPVTIVIEVRDAKVV